MKVLVKLGGTLLENESSRDQLAREITQAAAEGHRITVVHGGGKLLTRYFEDHGINSDFLDGLRVTRKEEIDGVVKIFCGTVNTGLVSAFRRAGARPVGLTGLDAGLVDAEFLDESKWGQVGRPSGSDARLLDLLTTQGYLPVVACIGGDAQGTVFNVNADQMAVACAIAFQADQLLFMTDVDGVLDAEKRIVPALTRAGAQALIASGVAKGGMQAKLDSAITALNSGVGQVRIAPGARPGLIAQLLSSGSAESQRGGQAEGEAASASDFSGRAAAPATTPTIPGTSLIP